MARVSGSRRRAFRHLDKITPLTIKAQSEYSLVVVDSQQQLDQANNDPSDLNVAPVQIPFPSRVTNQKLIGCTASGKQI